MTPDSTLYRVTADNGLSGLAVGCEAANELCDEMGQRADVESVEATPMPRRDIDPAEFSAMTAWYTPNERAAAFERLTRAPIPDVLEFLGHGESL